MSATTPNGIVLEREFTAPRAAVFAARSTPAQFARWFGGSMVDVPLGSLDHYARPGNAWTAQMVLPDGNTIDWTGEFLDVVPAERLVMTITDRPTESGRAQIVVELTETSTGTHALHPKNTGLHA